LWVGSGFWSRVRFVYPGYGSITIKMGSSFRWNDELGTDGVTARIPAFAGMTAFLAPLPPGEGLG